MPKTIIQSNPSFVKERPNHDNYIEVAEFFCDTLQGENFMGWPATFLRVKNCTQSCTWCDSASVWRFGNYYTFEELFQLIEENDLVRKFKEGQHLVLTGGSPVKSQSQLIPFIQKFIKKYGFKPFIEIENECTLMPKQELIDLVDCWNNSPKLSMSGNIDIVRYQPNILKKLSLLNNAWFKFVVGNNEDWEEIKRDFIDTGLIEKRQIVLMPLGCTQLELKESRIKVAEMAAEKNVRFSDRLHVTIWDKMVGV